MRPTAAMQQFPAAVIDVNKHFVTGSVAKETARAIHWRGISSDRELEFNLRRRFAYNALM